MNIGLISDLMISIFPDSWREQRNFQTVQTCRITQESTVLPEAPGAVDRTHATDGASVSFYGVGLLRAELR